MLLKPIAEKQLEPSVAVQVQLTPMRLAVKLSTTAALTTSLGPALDTVIVYVIGSPGIAVADPSLLVMLRSACGVSVSESSELSLELLPSVTPAGAATVAVFCSGLVA